MKSLYQRCLDRLHRQIRVREKFDSLPLAERERRMRGVRLSRRRTSVMLNDDKPVTGATE